MSEKSKGFTAEERAAMKERAKELFVALSTVKTHAKNIYAKLNARNRTQAVSRARELRLL